MRYYLLQNRRAEGPFEAADLLSRADFGEGSMVCPVGATTPDAWRRAEAIDELASALVARAAAAALGEVVEAAPAEEPAPEAAPEPAPEAAIEPAPAPEAAAPDAAPAGISVELPSAEPPAEAVEPAAEGVELEPAPADSPDPAAAEPVAAEAVAGEAGAPDAAAADGAAAPADEPPVEYGVADFAVSADGSAEAGGNAGENPARKLVMVVDDDAEFRLLLSTTIKREGFRVVSAQDGHDATGKLEPFTPDLVITDLMMPRQGGYEFIRAMQGAGHGDIPVIVVTGYTLDPTTVSSMRMEANIVDFFTKPLNMGSLTNLIHDKLGTKRLSPRQKLEQEKNDGWSTGL